MARAEANPQVIAALGRRPISEGLFASGSTNVNGPAGAANLAIDIRGPKGKATIYVEAQKAAGIWHFLIDLNRPTQ
ncbi:MAG: cytochrome c oxidase assembly factor Coa1 family protein [Chthoniobacterales bacterium]